MTPNPPPLHPSVEARVRELIKVYERAQKRIRTALTSAALTDFQQFRYAEHAAQVETIIEALNLVRRDLARGIIEPSYASGTNITEWALERANRRSSTVLLSQINRYEEALSTLNEESRKLLSEYTREVVRILLAG